MQLVRKQDVYEKYIKRIIDIVFSLLILIAFGWLYGIIALIVRVKLGSPVIFKQSRPGLIDSKTGKERIFDMYKFRTMTDERDENGNLLPDEQRLTPIGGWIRRTSMDELPEAINILKGDMSIIGPRPQLVRDMVFMDDRVRMRHTAKPGLSGLAQVNGRNAVTWEQKFEWDLKYLEKVSFMRDIKIVFATIFKVFGRNESSEEIAITLDYGDWLLAEGMVTREEFEKKQNEALQILGQNGRKE